MLLPKMRMPETVAYSPHIVTRLDALIHPFSVLSWLVSTCRAMLSIRPAAATVHVDPG